MLKNFIYQEPYKKMLNELKNKRKIIYLTYGGSLAYGTNNENSDIDLRGIALKTKDELLGFKNFEQFINTETDTTIYAVDKFFNLALNCNPNIIELLGTEQEHKFLVSDEMQLILENKDIFLSQRAINSFGGYAKAQLRRLENKINRSNKQALKEVHIKDTLENMKYHLQEHYTSYRDGDFELFIDDSDKEGLSKELFANINLKKYPLRDFQGIANEMSSVIRGYNKKVKSIIDNKKIDKHAMHLVRLYHMAFDILEKGQINTYTKEDHQLLMDIRNGLWRNNNYEKLYEYLTKLNTRMDYAKKNTNLPRKPNYKVAEELLITINEKSLN